jgi:hypothetical protein
VDGPWLLADADLDGVTAHELVVDAEHLHSERMTS